MQRVFRPLAVFSIATGACLALGLQLLVNGAQGSDAPRASGGLFGGYDLAKLDLVEQTLFHIDESYVDPARIDWEVMFVAALDAIERRVPSVLFAREPGRGALGAASGRGTAGPQTAPALVAVEIGDFRTVLEIGPVTTRSELYRALTQISGLLRDHLVSTDVPVRHPKGGDPLAEIEYAAINGMLATLDPHSMLLPPDDARDMDAENQGEFGGLGITIELDPVDARLMVAEEPEPNTPAARAGLRPRDRILRIDGESTVNLRLEDAVTRLRGPVGTPVDLEVGREGAPAPIPMRIVRELIAYLPVEGKLLDGAVAYIEIKGFHDRAEADLQRLLTELTREADGRLAGLVLDLRGNPGGFLNQAVKIADTFLESGQIVSTIDREGRRADLEQATRDAEPLYPIAVLVDSSSASASEIVAGALRYNERAVVIGERTFGKGSVQNLHPFSDDSKLKLTISKYLTAGDRSLQAVGIPADIELDPAYIPTDLSDRELFLFAQEAERREADFERALERVTADIDPPAYRIRYVQSAPGSDRDAPTEDLPVRLARDVLKAASGWRRSDVLTGAATVVARNQKLGNDAISAALSARGIDWRTGPPGSTTGGLPVRLTVEVVGGGPLEAGTHEKVAVTAENIGSRPLYRVAAVATDGGVLSRREFLFGLLGPGEKRTYVHEFDVPAGWPSEQLKVEFAVRDAGKEPLGTVPAEITYAGRALPTFAWSWVANDTAHGNGDGVLQAGERVEVALTVRNVGQGASTDAFARLRNYAGAQIDLLVGTLLPGVVQTGSGCGGEQQKPCPRRLGPGESWSGSFELRVDPAESGEGGPLELALDLGDGTAYDQAAGWRAAMMDSFQQEERITFAPDASLPVGELHEPPVIEVTRDPGLRVDGSRAVISGAVRDDRGLQHVMVYVGEDKVFLETGTAGPQHLRSLPFTADAVLESGPNVVTVVATDDQGSQSTRSVVIWHDGEAVAQAGR